jgi:GT2 family glycosyltransferase
MPADGAVTAIIVGTGEPPDVLARLIASLRRQTLSPAQMVCVDQSPDGRYAVLADAPDSEVEVLGLRENLGYPSACNRGAQRATQEYLLFINPYAEADASCIAELHDALDARRDAVIAGAQVLLPDGRVNAGDNALHLTGLSWAGRYGLAPESGPPRPAAVVSGATLMVRRDAFEALGGYTEGFFMYYDDVDLAWRARLLGWEVLFCPSATLAHDYEFTKGSYKWT